LSAAAAAAAADDAVVTYDAQLTAPRRYRSSHLYFFGFGQSINQSIN